MLKKCQKSQNFHLSQKRLEKEQKGRKFGITRIERDHNLTFSKNFKTFKNLQESNYFQNFHLSLNRLEIEQNGQNLGSHACK